MGKRTVFILMLAFGIHEVFEGVAFGLMDRYDVAVELAVAILIHDTCTAVYHGFEFAKKGFSLGWVVLFVFLCSLFTPVGIVIGLSINHVNELVTSIFFQLSVGTFIYVACTKIITHEFRNPAYSGLKMLLILLGGIVIVLLWFMKKATDH